MPDSYSWVILSQDGEVVEEAVHQPTIPSATLAAAEQLRDGTSSPDKRRAFHAKLSIDGVTDIPDGEVTIRHGSSAESDPNPFASYDVLTGEGRGERAFHFDASGKRFEHPSMKRASAQEAKKP